MSEKKNIPTSNQDNASVGTNQESNDAFVWGQGIGLDVSSSRMSVRLEIDLNEAEHYTPEDVVRYLKEQHLNTEGCEDQVRRIFEQELFNQSIEVIKGEPAKDGEDGYVQWVVDLSVLEGAKLVEQGGRVDWKQMHHVLQVEEDQLLGRLIEPTAGEAGQDVYGEKIDPKPGKPSKLPAGKGIRVSEDGKEMYAEISGAVSKEGEKVCVSPVYAIQGDVSLKTGNIDFHETVEVSGGVLADFAVKAGQDIHVNGLVEGATLNAGGSIYIYGGIQGDEKALIQCGGDLVVKYINNAKVEVQGDVLVNGAISNSYVRAKGSVLVDGSKAVIQGGTTSAEKEISAEVLGAEIGTKTHLVLGEEVVELQRKKVDEEKVLESLVANYKKIKHASDTLNQMREKGKITQEQEGLRLKLIRTGLQVQGQVKNKHKEIQALQKQINSVRKQQKGIAARSIAWPGCMITIMGRKYPVKAQTSKAVFAYKSEEIEVFAYKKKEEKKKEKRKK